MFPNATVVQELRATCTATGTWQGQGMQDMASFVRCVDDNFPRYVIAATGQSCTQGCSGRGLACSESRGREVNSLSEFSSVLSTLVDGWCHGFRMVVACLKSLEANKMLVETQSCSLSLQDSIVTRY